MNLCPRVCKFRLDELGNIPAEGCVIRVGCPSDEEWYTAIRSTQCALADVTEGSRSEGVSLNQNVLLTPSYVGRAFPCAAHLTFCGSLVIERRLVRFLTLG